MKTRNVLLLLLLPALSHGTEYMHAVGDSEQTVREATDCFDISERAAAKCVRHFAEESEKELAATFETIRSRLVRDRLLFEQTQAKWASFRDSECEVQSVSAQAYSDPETQKWLFVQACAADLNAQRVLQLKAIPLGCDSCLQ